MQNNIPKPLQQALKNKNLNLKHFGKTETEKLIKSLSKEDAEKLNSILQNKQALHEVLNTEQAQSIMNALFGKS